mgnify:CR=1 FL=1
MVHLLVIYYCYLMEVYKLSNKYVRYYYIKIDYYFLNGKFSCYILLLFYVSLPKCKI